MGAMGAAFGPPTDPAYLRFLSGLKQVGEDPEGKLDWKWHPKDGKWYRYDVADWAMEDRGIPATPTENALESHGFPTVTWAVNEIWVPRLFERVQKAYSDLVGKHPSSNLVWSALGGGTWRNALKRPPGPLPPDPGHSGLPAECLKRIERVRLFEQGGYITRDEAQRRINAIVDECT